MSIIVRMNAGAAYKVKGDRWTEPPVQPSPFPGVLEHSELELDKQQLAEARQELAACAGRGETPALGRGWHYTSIQESLFIVVYQGDRKAAAFNPTEVDTIYFDDDARLLEDDE